LTYVVKGECVDCKHTSCVAVCPVDCFFEGENTLVIDPDICIDCAICEPECPVDAIVSDRKLKPEDHHWLEFNKKMSQVEKWPVITKVKDPMPGYEDINYDTSEAFDKASRIPFVDITNK
jgi:ferredoxin